jgi:hypothetical protein
MRLQELVELAVAVMVEPPQSLVEMELPTQAEVAVVEVLGPKMVVTVVPV